MGLVGGDVTSDRLRPNLVVPRCGLTGERYSLDSPHERLHTNNE